MIRSSSRHPFQRYKGLGNGCPTALGNNHGSQNRKLLQVHIEDAIEADQVFEDLMGEKVEPRKDFINENALFVKNLDV